MRLFDIINEQILLEISDKVKSDMREKYKEKDPNLTDDQIDFYLDRWDRYVQSFPPNKRDITKISFRELERLIDHAETVSQLKGRAKQEYDFDLGDDLLYDKDNLVIYRGDAREKCIRYGEGYTWCISRKDSSNLYYSYRMGNDQPIFYFVFDKNRDVSDPFHAVVVHVLQDGRFKLTTAPNAGDRNISWEEIVSQMPRLSNLKQIFQPKPISKQEQEFYTKFGRPVDLEAYRSYTLKDKYQYIQMGHRLSTEQQIETPKELVGVYVKMPGRDLDDIALSTLDRLKGGDLRKILSAIKPNNAYDLIMKRGYNYNPKSNTLKSFMGELVELAKQHVSDISLDDTYSLEGLYGGREEHSDSETTEYYRELDQFVTSHTEEVIENQVLTTPENAYKFANRIVDGRWQRGEDVIATSPKYTYLYAKDCLKNERFPKGEPAIAKHAGASVLYAANIIGGAFPMAEDSIIKNHRTSYEYARHALKKAFPKGENAISTDAESSYNYAVIVLGERFPEGEPAIASIPAFKYKYERRFGVEL